MAQDMDKNKHQSSNPGNQGNQSSNQDSQNNPGNQSGKSGSQQDKYSNPPHDISKKNPGQHGSEEYDKSDKGQGESEPKRRVS
jgi:hypothetical protein